MKLHLLIICIITSQLAHAQPKPVGFAQIYTYGSRENLPAGGNFTGLWQDNNGSLLASNYTKPWFRLTNTNIKDIHFGSGLNPNERESILVVGNSQKWFAMQGVGLVQLKNDSFYSKPEWKKSMNYACEVAGQVYALTEKKGYQEFVRFDGTKWQKLNLPLPTYYYEDAYLTLTLGLSSQPILQIATFNKTLETWKPDTIASQFNLHKSFIWAKDILPINALHTDTPVVYKNGKAYKLGINGQLTPFLRESINFLSGYNSFYAEKLDNYTNLVDATGNSIVTIGVANSDRWQMVTASRFWPGYFVGTAGSLFRVFPYIRHYPKLYKNAHTLATHSLMQTDDGSIIAGNYSGDMAYIKDNMAYQVPENKYPVLPGGSGVGQHYYYFIEGANALVKGSLSKKPVLLKPPILTSGYFVKGSSDGTKILTGLSTHTGIGILSLKDADAGRPNWEFIDSSKGVKLLNVLTIAEDPLGRLWFGRPSEGWGVYNPVTEKGVTYRIPDGQTNFGAVSSAVDNQGFVWLGGRNGLWFANGKKNGMPTPNDVKKLEHPLLPSGTDLSAMQIWGSYLIIGAGKRVLLLNLDHFHQYQPTILNGKVIPSIKYLNPHELDLTAEVEQNCMLVDKRDSSLWIGTNNQVYQVDVKKWLQLPFYAAKASIQVIAGPDTFLLNPSQALSLKPTSNSLQINILYQTPDNMPRLIQKALQAEGDSIRWFGPDTDHQLVALNRRSGNYTFHLRILQSDGTITTHSFPITIRRFLWQQWWFWLLISSMVMGVSFYLFYLHKQKQLAQEEAKRIKAEAEALRSEQQRQLTSMQVKSLSTQFRPHFILNALNTVGAQLYDKPEVDAVLGQLGDSIGIIFKNAQSGAIAHPLSQEWRLVMSVINIKQLELQNTVTVHLNVPENLLNEAAIQVPMGILQIPVENALVHGLRNKETGPKDLWITATQSNEGELCVTVLDNGIGRKAAAAMGNYRSNGVGTRNIQAILDLLNPYNEKPITIQYRDAPFEEGDKTTGTEVTICVPENYLYER